MKYDVFISYSRKDSNFVSHLNDDLQSAGFRVWTDEKIALGEHWDKAIEQAIRESRLMLVILSPNSSKSEWLQNEIQLAKAYNTAILPILISGSKPEGVLEDTDTLAVVDASRDYDRALRELTNDLRDMVTAG